MAIQFIPLLIAGALATAGGVAIKQNEVNKAQKRADAANALLRKNQKKFEDEAQLNLRSSVDKFGSQAREDAKNNAIEEGEAILGQSLERDRGDFATSPEGKTSNAFIDRRAGVQENLDARAERLKTNLARVVAPGQQGFEEKSGILRGQQTDNTIRGLQRGQLGVDTLKVDEAGRVKDNFLGDLLLAVGPALATGGALGAAGGAAGAGTSVGTGAATFGNLAGSSGVTLGALPAATGITGAGAAGIIGSQGIPLLANSFTPRRGFAPSN